MNIKDYNIGDELFRYVDGGGVFRYLVIGRREYQEDVQLEVECQTCSHGWKCKLLVAQNDYGHIEHVHMLNEDEDDRQRNWHCNEGHYFVATVEAAKQGKVKKLIADAKERVRKAEDALAAEKNRLAELKGMDEGVQP